MAWDGIWRVGEAPLGGEQVLKIQDRALRAFGSYAAPLGVTRSEVYDAPTAAFIQEFQERKQASGYRPILPAHPNAERGDCDYETKKALGILPTAVVPGPATPLIVGYAVPGTWGVWNIGPQVMAVNRFPEKVQVQGVGSNTGAFLNPDPSHSYADARNEQVAELLRLALPDFRKKIVSGYSLGADSVVRFLHAWPADRRDEILGVITFGSPGRPPGPTKLGPDPGGAGISSVYTPEWARDREWSYTIDGDMYPEAEGLLPALYELLTRMEATPEFAKYLFTWLTGIPLDLGSILGGLTAAPTQIGAGLLGLASLAGSFGALVPGFGALAPILGMITPGAVSQTTGPVSLAQILFNIPAIVVTLVAGLKFLFTNAHGKYWIDPIFEGMVAEDHAAKIVRQLAA